MSDILTLFAQFGNLVVWVGQIFSNLIYNFYKLMEPSVQVIGMLPEFVRSFLIASFVVEFVYLILGR